MSIEVKVFRKGPPGFQQMTPGASGYDLYAQIPDSIDLAPFTPHLIPSGICLAAPEGLEVQIRPRSSLSRKGILVSFGTVDSDYRGELSVVLLNLTTTPYKVHPQDRVGQAVFMHIADVRCSEVGSIDELGETVRGASGYGSTGR